MRLIFKEANYLSNKAIQCKQPVIVIIIRTSLLLNKGITNYFYLNLKKLIANTCIVTTIKSPKRYNKNYPFCRKG